MMDYQLTDCDRLHLAASEGDTATIRLLLESGCDPNCRDTVVGFTPLHAAAEAEHLEAVRSLFSAGANPNATDEATAGDTPLGHVAQNCSLELAKLLVDAGANPLIPGCMQLTPLMRSERRKRPEGVRVHQLLLHTARTCFHYDG